MEFSLTGRAVDEWIGKTPDTQPPKAVKDRLFLRQNGRCAITGTKIRPGDKTDVDHVTPLKDGGENRESNLQIVLVEAHREKTKRENKERAHYKRVRLKHHGQWPETKRKIPSRPFNGGGK